MAVPIKDFFGEGLPKHRGRKYALEINGCLRELLNVYHSIIHLPATTMRSRVRSHITHKRRSLFIHVFQFRRPMPASVLTVGSSVRSAAILRVFGSQVAELPLVATDSESQGLGYFQALYACIERLLASLRVKHLVLPSAEEAESIWVRKFGVRKITTAELNEYTQGTRTMVFEGTSTLHKLVPSNLEIS